MYKLVIAVLTFTAMSYGTLISSSSTLNGVTTTTYSSTIDYSSGTLLQHGYAYAWEEQLALSSGEIITSAKLDIIGLKYSDNIANALWIDLLNDPGVPNGTQTKQLTDGNSSYNVDYFAPTGISNSDSDRRVNSGLRLDRLDYSDGKWWDERSTGTLGVRTAITPINASLNQTISFSTTELTALKDYVATNGDFGFGIDPDCHYNGKFTVSITTTKSTSVPEPSILSLLGFGICSLFFFRRKKK
jgi:hypothetical protein